MFFRTMITLAAASVSLTACGPVASPDVAPVDLVPSSLSPNGCLDLARAFASLRSMGADTSVRIHTTHVFIDGTGLRRNFLGEISYSNFRFNDLKARDAVREWPLITQNGCDSAVVDSGAAGSRLFQIVPGDDVSTLKLQRDDGYVIEWKIVGPRRLTSTTTTAVMDRCPEYASATATTETEYRWGTQDEVTATDVFVSRSMLRAISSVVVDMPRPLLTLATFDTDDVVRARANDLSNLTRTTIDPELQVCPYRVEPPVGAEPPPPPPGSSLPN